MSHGALLVYLMVRNCIKGTTVLLKRYREPGGVTRICTAIFSAVRNSVQDVPMERRGACRGDVLIGYQAAAAPRLCGSADRPVLRAT
jgi:hypothetical protein